MFSVSYSNGFTALITYAAMATYFHTIDDTQIPIIDISAKVSGVAFGYLVGSLAKKSLQAEPELIYAGIIGGIAVALQPEKTIVIALGVLLGPEFGKSFYDRMCSFENKQVKLINGTCSN